MSCVVRLGLGSNDERLRQLATAAHLIDVTLIRVGREPNDGSVGCCSLAVKNVKLFKNGDYFASMLFELMSEIRL